MGTAAYPGYVAERHAASELDGAWRKAAIVAVAVAAIELVALIAVLVAIVVRPFTQHHPTASAHRVGPAAPAPVHHTAPKPAVQHFTRAVLSRTHTHVLVLNGNGRSGAAAGEASALTARGYRIAATGNAPRSDYAATIVMYRPGFSREAKRLSHDAGISVVAPLDGLRDSRADHAQLVVILGR